MELRTLGRTGLRVSELCLGTMTFGRPGETDEPTAAAMLDRFLDAGGNFVDTADVYAAGGSEEILGRTIGSHRRDRLVLATKCRFPMGDGPNDEGANRRHIIRALEASLRRLRTEWIDLYQIHCWDPRPAVEETMAALDDCVRAGKVRYLGASNYAAWQLLKSNAVAAARGGTPFLAVQPQYSLAARDVERELLPMCAAEQIAVLPWSPLGGGLLSGKYQRGAAAPEGTRATTSTPAGGSVRARLADDRLHAVAATVRDIASARGRTPAQVALNWVLHRGGVTSPIIGARTLEQLEDNLGCTGWFLDDDAVSTLEEASAIDLGYPHDFHLRVGAR
jgi:aryl-alcohol dehydrogenase-like predicted oxidoreductase